MTGAILVPIPVPIPGPIPVPIRKVTVLFGRAKVGKNKWNNLFELCVFNFNLFFFLLFIYEVWFSIHLFYLFLFLPILDEDASDSSSSDSDSGKRRKKEKTKDPVMTTGGKTAPQTDANSSLRSTGSLPLDPNLADPLNLTNNDDDEANAIIREKTLQELEEECVKLEEDHKRRREELARERKAIMDRQQQQH
jgi:hypothetical protein